MNQKFDRFHPSLEQVNDPIQFHPFSKNQKYTGKRAEGHLAEENLKLLYLGFCLLLFLQVAVYF